MQAVIQGKFYAGNVRNSEYSDSIVSYNLDMHHMPRHSGRQSVDQTADL
jgi:hypothetical protein